MKIYQSLLFALLLSTNSLVWAQEPGLRMVFIRHGEKPDDGDNLNCQGLSRSLLLPAVLYKKFGRPGNIYIPAVNSGSATKHVRMLQTIGPFAIKYNLTLNSDYDVQDAKGIAKALLKEKGTVLVVWEHQGLAPILHYVGISGKKLKWPSGDFDSIWIVTFKQGKAILTIDKESLSPNSGCAF
jgi:hypothetical protein